MRKSDAGREVLGLLAAVVLVLVLGCGTWSGGQRAEARTLSVPGGKVDITATGDAHFHVTGDRVTCNGDMVYIDAADYPEMGSGSLAFLAEPNGGPGYFSTQWLGSPLRPDGRLVSTGSGATSTRSPLSVSLSGDDVGDYEGIHVLISGTVSCPVAQSSTSA